MPAADAPPPGPDGDDGAREWPATAEALMRSRFQAFKEGDSDWLLASWHSSTRPHELDLGDNPRWRGLQVVRTEAGGVGDDTGVVEFRATYLLAGGELGIQHEVSRFVREGGRWFYLDEAADSPRIQ
ncbi:YchJ family protein [Aestuariimicrobium sp. Y1814]|uniref:YchJ family protein n=1 Tax=Aestuariimicrobium sp. Y1814 TaxID=3418742 RepID=UPI003DA6F97C